jgi:protein-serine/threonine kinase
MHTPTSPHIPSPSSHSWKSVFLRRHPSSKKLASNSVNSSSLTLDTRTLSSQANGISKSPITSGSSLTPASVMSVDPRSSYNSSNTQSSDSNPGAQSRLYLTQPQRPYTSYQSQPSSPDVLSASLPKSRTRTRSEKYSQRAALGRSPQAPQTAQPLASFSPRSPAFGHRQGGPPASKSMGALPRFIRRVASAPNAKDLFSPKTRSGFTTTKNGLLVPAETVPPVPVMPSTTSSEQGTELGTDSLETSSSGSSRRRSARPTRGHNSMPNQKTSNGHTEEPEKAAFRRTYSSNSIKVRSVSLSQLG